jgi:hypothetical protein
MERFYFTAAGWGHTVFMRRIGLLFVVWTILAVRLPAQFVGGRQDKVDPATVGTVTGRVTFAENRLPARFAEVILVRRPDAEDLLPDFSNGPPKELPKPAAKPAQKVVSISGRSGFDGAYTIGEVPPGDYYIVAKMQGYVVPIRRATNSKETRDIDKLAADLPMVHVEAARMSMADVALHRGGVISGKVQFRDGSPVVGMQVRAELADAPEVGMMWATLPYMPLATAVSSRGNGMDFGTEMLTTDDDGHFRLAGLAPGKYRVSAQLQMGGGTRTVSNGPTGSSGGGIGRPVTLTVYGPGVMRRSQGKVFEIKGDERFTDADIEVDLSGLHAVRGRVLAKEDGHAPNAVYLALTEDGEDDPAMRMPRVVAIDGAFTIENVAPGTYTLRVQVAEDIEEIPQEKLAELNKQASSSGIGEMLQPKVLKRYGAAHATVIVAEDDVTVDDILLTEAKPEADETAPQ